MQINAKSCTFHCIEMHKKAKICITHTCASMDGVRMARTFFRRSSNFWSGCGHRSGLMVRIIRAAGLNGSPLIGSQPLLSRLMRMHRYGLSPSSGLDRLPLHRVRSHQFKKSIPAAFARVVSGDCRRGLAERLSPAHHGPGDPSQFVCNRDCDDARWSSFE